jgi:hypothetical protein
MGRFASQAAVSLAHDDICRVVSRIASSRKSYPLPKNPQCCVVDDLDRRLTALHQFREEAVE